jgi:hypothetical protein
MRERHGSRDVDRSVGKLVDFEGPHGTVPEHGSHAPQQLMREGQRGVAADVQSLEAGRDRSMNVLEFVPLLHAPGDDMIYWQQNAFPIPGQHVFGPRHEFMLDR